MNNRNKLMSTSRALTSLLVATVVALTALPLFAGAAAAQEDFVVHDRERGELSPGTRAPSRAAMVSAIEGNLSGSYSAEALFSTLEYGERVECHACVPLLERAILESSEPRVREIAAWWLRRRPFGFAPVFRQIRMILQDSSETPLRRARAAEAIGEFLDPHGVAILQGALETDPDATVRRAAVLGLARLNSPAGNPAIAAAMSDSDAEVRNAAVQSVLLVNFFRDHDALIERLADDNDEVRQRAAQTIGQLRVEASVAALAGLLRGDSSRMVRQAAAWSLGRIGGAEAQAALREVRDSESDTLVLNAIDIALRMR